MAKMPVATRSPWIPNFPPVIAQTQYGNMKSHVAYRTAKSGTSEENALNLVLDCINDHAIQRLRAVLKGRRPRIVAVHAIESEGRNKIPLAYGEVLGGVLGLPTDPGIVQASIANHTDSKTIYHRMVSQPIFDGYVEKGAEYLIVDDTCTAGGTLANLKGFIEDNGGAVLAMSVLALRDPRLEYYISLADGTLARLRLRHPGLDVLWQTEFSYGLDRLTEGEAGHLLAAASTDTIRNRLAEARRDQGLDSDEGDTTRANWATKVVHPSTPRK